MAVRTEDRCVDCGLPCLGSSCPYRNTKVFYCDKCDEEVDKLYQYDDMQLCSDCLLDTVPEVDY